ncbi:MAG: CheY-like chemotaxis protein [Candidatus Krumholzibacteriia bacterium]|jgi:CheY-like chemotaxis protein
MARILVIEDDTLTREWLESLLTRNGYAVDTASNGKQGTEMFVKSAADLVVTDIVMPEKDGIETITHLKRHNPKVKVIAISGGERRPVGLSRHYLHSAKLIGADRAMQKPITNEDMLAAVAELLS